uniref:Uncharacterized protein n=1 Tax=Anguilla anguilla TaxID=7936 RepID=A0A0E9R8D7_ANGAN
MTQCKVLIYFWVKGFDINIFCFYLFLCLFQ